MKSAPGVGTSPKPLIPERNVIITRPLASSLPKTSGQFVKAKKPWASLSLNAFVMKCRYNDHLQAHATIVTKERGGSVPDNVTI